jgi:hypothetical protein
MSDKKDDALVSPYGSIFLGNPDNVKRDGYYNSTDGPQAGGQVDYIPEYECTGGSTNPADKVCPHLLAPENNDNKADDGGDTTTTTIAY